MVSSVKPIAWATTYVFAVAAFSLCLFHPVARVGAATVTLNPTADNWISSCSSGSTVNNGAMTEVRVRTSWWGPGGSQEPKNFRSLLQFDLASLPEDPNLITSATVGLYYFNYSGSSGHSDPVGRTIDVHSLTRPWTQNGSTWLARDDYDQPSPVYWDSYLAGVPGYQPGGADFDPSAVASAVVPAAFGWMTWDVTDLVTGWLGGQDNFGLLLKDSDEIESNPGGKVSYMARFRSAEYADDTTLRPYLEVSYIPEPTTAVLLGMGLVALGRIRRGRS